MELSLTELSGKVNGGNGTPQAFKLLKVIIPASITLLGNGVFTSCNNLMDVTLENIYGWYAMYSLSSSDKTSVTFSNTNKMQNANLIKSTYHDYDLVREEY